jgi:hypothetical protein
VARWPKRLSVRFAPPDPIVIIADTYDLGDLMEPPAVIELDCPGLARNMGGRRIR